MTPEPQSPELLAPLVGVDEGALTALHARLVAAASQGAILDVSYRVVDSPLGGLLLAATPAGLVRVAFEREGHDEVLEDLATRVSPRVLRATGRLDAAARELGEYFERRRTTFDLPLDLQLSSGFRRRVLGHLCGIAYGTTATYAAVAAAVGSPRAVRAVGTACATNPVPVVVPCHRVVRSDGSTGAYGGGTEVKQMLLRMEARR